MTAWIKTSDSRPADGDRVLFYATDGNVHFGMYCVDSNIKDEPPYVSWHEADWTWEDSEVTHWARVDKPEVA
jgi:hypothetical protein